MSKTKSFRELQFTSSQLAAVFLGVLVVGVIIFILGVSVGKKQGHLAAASPVAGAAGTEIVAEKKPAPAAEIKTETAPDKKTTPAEAAGPTPLPAVKTENPPPAVKTEAKPPAGTNPVVAKPAEAKPAGNFFVQVGAVNDKAAADAFAKKVEGLGFRAFVADPWAADKKTIYRVRIGPYATKEDAENARTKVAAALNKKRTDFFLVKG